MPVATNAAQTARPATPLPGSHAALSIVILVQGNYLWLGNQLYVDKSDHDYFPGAFPDVVAAIDSLVDHAEPGTRAGMVTYGWEIRVSQPMADIRELSGADLGNQHDYINEVVAAFHVAIMTGDEMLAAEHGRRKILVIIGDGAMRESRYATQSAADRTRLRLTDAGIEVYTIDYRVLTQDSWRNIKLFPTLAGNSRFRKVIDSEGLTSALLAVLKPPR